MSSSHRPLAQARLTAPAGPPSTAAATSCRPSSSAPATAIKELDPYTKLFEERIIFLGVQIDDASANDVMAQLLAWSRGPRPRHHHLHQLARRLVHGADRDLRHDAVHPPGDPDRLPRPGRLRRRGAARRRHQGKRLALPNARILIHQPSSEGGGQSTDIEIQANEIMRMRSLDGAHARRRTRGGREEQVSKDIERDKILTAAEAVDYGLIDEVLEVCKRRAEVRSA